MSKIYSITYEKIYARLSTATGMSKNEIDLFLLKFIKIITSDLHRKGECVLPYLGKFTLKRMPPRRRIVKDFATGNRTTINVPAEDKLKFKINKSYSKLFR